MKNMPANKTKPIDADSYRRWWEETFDGPFGLCLCGCGQPTKLSSNNHAPTQRVKGQPLRYLRGHNTKTRPSQQSVFPGDVFGQLTVLDYRRGRYALALCRCTCGTEKWIRVDHLRQSTVSCGCYKSKMVSQRSRSRITHGHRTQAHMNATSPTYASFAAMNDRCHNPNSSSWKWYGGKEDNPISVCERWRFGTPDAFKNFLEDMGIRPLGTELSRTDDAGDYEPGNVEWASHGQNIRNRVMGK